jgi:hypothetical protein
VAHYWTGGAPIPRKIRNVSATGAFIEAPDEWPSGTIVKLIMQAGLPSAQAPPGSGGPSPYELHGTVVRLEPNGFAVEFLYRNHQERAAFERFLRDSPSTPDPEYHAILETPPAGE